jgi:mxaA protein
MMVLAAVCGLAYINGDASWFPGMGGPFAASYRQIGSLPNSPEGALAAATSIHQAFNLTYGENVFFQNLDQFLQNHPGFQSARAEIASFFELSNHLLYGISAGDSPSANIPALLEFCRHCRDCERGVA